ncbi:MAG: hypothetical protein ACM3QR_00475 [Syntrophothermus sp.]
MNYTDDIIHAVRFTGGEDYLDQLEIWEVFLKIYPGKNGGSLTVGVSEIIDK